MCLACETPLLETAADRDRPADEVRKIARVCGTDGGHVHRCPACTSYNRFSVAAAKGTRIVTGGVKLQGDGLGSRL
jgi:hypothetical protein